MIWREIGCERVSEFAASSVGLVVGVEGQRDTARKALTNCPGGPV
jgi:hypothetical protein